jgi:hypothetical protein
MRGEYQGGFYALLEFIGVYVRYFFLFLCQNRKGIQYLSGEENFPSINKKQRFFCLIVGIISIVSFIVFVFGILYYV